jgi:ElaB/YqjD/DUF883 family membrane-anchored ribosome-binding protein
LTWIEKYFYYTKNKNKQAMPLTPLPKKSVKKKTEEKILNPPPAELPVYQEPAPVLSPPPESNPNIQPQATISMESIPVRDGPQQISPALYQGEPDQEKYFQDPNQNNQVINGLNDDIFTLRKQLEEKNKEIDQIFGTFKEIKSSYETLNLQNENLKTQIETLKSSVEMKETQIKTLTETIKMKDDQINMKDDQIKMKEDQVQIYTKSLDDKSKAYDSLQNASVDKSVIDAKDAEIGDRDNQIVGINTKIKELEEEAELLKSDIDAADDEVEGLHEKLNKIESEAKDAIFLSRGQVLSKIKAVLKDALHNVTLTIPSIEDIADLDLYDVKTSVNLKVSCNIDLGNPKHSEMMEEFQVFDNITLRIYDTGDRWSIMKDGEMLFMGVVGVNKDKILSFQSGDEKIIKVFNSLVMESWLRGRKIK